jgi:hypothetical protein
MQPRSTLPPPSQPTLPLRIPRRAGPQSETEEVLVDRCAPEEAWERLGPVGRDRLRKAWTRVLKEVMDDAQEDR